MSTLVTGASGQVGSHLVAALSAAGEADVVATDRTAPAQLPPGVTFVEADLLNEKAMSDLVAAHRFTSIFHLAGLNGFAPTTDIYRVNVLGGAVLHAAIRASGRKDISVVTMSSSAVYGPASADAISEDHALAPATHYGASKAALERLSTVAGSDGGYSVMLARPFNIVGPGQRSPLLHSAVASQVAKCELGLQDPVLRLGNLNAFRDFIDVRDVAAALIALRDHGKDGQAYNIASGQAVQARTLVNMLAAMSRIPVEIHADAIARAGADVSRQCGDSRKLQTASGWHPAFTLEESLRDSLQYWRSQLA